MSQTLDLPRKMAHSEGDIVIEVVNRLRHAAALLLGRLVAVSATLVTLATLLLLRGRVVVAGGVLRSEEHTSELQSRPHLVCRLLLEKKNIGKYFSLVQCS